MMPFDEDISLELISSDAVIWLTRQGVPAVTVIRLMPIMMARGIINTAGYFDPNDTGEPFIAFQEPEDTIFWHPVADRIGTLLRRAFALNEDWIGNACTYSFDANLNIYLLRAGRCPLYRHGEWQPAYPEPYRHAVSQ